MKERLRRHNVCWITRVEGGKSVLLVLLKLPLLLVEQKDDVLER